MPLPTRNASVTLSLLIVVLFGSSTYLSAWGPGHDDVNRIALDRLPADIKALVLTVTPTGIPRSQGSPVKTRRSFGPVSLLGAAISFFSSATTDCPTNTTATIITRICFMPISIRQRPQPPSPFGGSPKRLRSFTGRIRVSYFVGLLPLRRKGTTNRTER